MANRLNNTSLTQKRLMMLEEEDKRSFQPTVTGKASAGASKTNLLNIVQRKEASLVDKLPDDFPIDQWDSMRTKAQLATMRYSGLDEKDQWTLLNASTPLDTLAMLNKIQSGLNARNLSLQQATTLANAANRLAADRINLTSGDASILPPLQKNILRGELENRLNVLKTITDRISPQSSQPVPVPTRTLPQQNPLIRETPTASPAPETTPEKGNVLTNAWDALKNWVAGLFASKDTTSSPTPTSTQQVVPIELDPLSITPSPTPMPTPSPTPSPTPKPTANVDMIGELVNNGRKNGDSFYLNYSQVAGNRDDCSTQVFSFYSLKGDKNPLLGADHETCESYYLMLLKNQKSFVKQGGTLQSTVPRDNQKGIPSVPDNWQTTTQFGDMVIWKESPEYDNAGRLLNYEDDKWHIGLCTGDGQMLDRGQWEENNPNGLEEGLFVRGLNTIKSTYDLIMIIRPDDKARLTPDDIYEYLLNPPK